MVLCDGLRRFLDVLRLSFLCLLLPQFRFHNCAFLSLSCCNMLRHCEASCQTHWSSSRFFVMSWLEYTRLICYVGDMCGAGASITNVLTMIAELKRVGQHITTLLLNYLRSREEVGIAWVATTLRSKLSKPLVGLVVLCHSLCRCPDVLRLSFLGLLLPGFRFHNCHVLSLSCCNRLRLCEASCQTHWLGLSFCVMTWLE